MKRILALLLALVMLFCLTACGGDEESTTTGENTGATTTNTTESTNGPTDGTQGNTQGTTEGTLENTVGGNQNNTPGSTGNSIGGNQNNTQEASGNNQSNLQGSTNNTASSENTTTGNNSPTTLPSAQTSHFYTEIGNVIPVGGAYVFRKNYESIYEGTIPTSPSVGDYFYYGDYRYEFVYINNKYGWDVYAESLTDGTQYKSSYGKILLSINNFPIIAMTSTFHSNPKIKTAPSIPITVVDMTQTFHSCTALVSAPKLPEGLLSMAATFADCPALKTYDGAAKGTPDGDFSRYNIPSKVSDNDIIGAFYACPRITVLPRRVSNSEPTPSTPSPSTPQPVRVSGVQISKTTLSLNVGDTQQLTATVSPSNADNKNVTWSSSNSSVAQVSNTGKITANGAGSTTITVTTVDGNYTAKCAVIVTAPSSPEPVSNILIISNTQTISNQTIDTDVYITSTGIATFNNVTVNGNIYCYGQLKCSGCTANNVYAYAYGSMMSCGAFDGTHGKVSGGISCNNMTILNNALDYAFNKWGKK
ncbi:MAG: Ig-like domain-containing protein [Clostridia bacterium]|nr:Ig-like domain-containing protein [Clostridia bacterium]